MKRGHLAWKVTELVKKTGFSRSLIYQYFGSNKEKMLKAALGIFIDRFYGFEKEPKAQPLAVMVGRAREYVMNYPETSLLYQKIRMEKSEFSEEFRNIETKFRKKLTKNFPELTEDQVLMVHVFIHGMVTAPFLTAKESTRICDAFMRGAFFKS